MPKPSDLTAETFHAEVLDADGPVLVDFWSPTCPHCQRLTPHFETAAESEAERVKFVKVSAEDARELFGQHGVHAVPTLVLFRDGREVIRRQGATTSDEIVAWLKEHA